MKISKGIEHFYNYQRLNVKKNTFRNYEFILEKDLIDEIIFRTRNPRNRLMLELMARSYPKQIQARNTQFSDN